MGNFVCFLVFGFFLTIAQSALVPLVSVGGVRVELLLVLLTYVALHYPVVLGSFLAVAIGYFYGLNSAAPLGLHMLTFITCFLALNLTRSQLLIQGPVFCIGLCSMLVVVHEILLFIFLTSRGHATWPPLSQWALVIPKALLTGAFWPFFSPIFQRFDRWFPLPQEGRRRGGKLDFKF